ETSGFDGIEGLEGSAGFEREDGVDGFDRFSQPERATAAQAAAIRESRMEISFLVGRAVKVRERGAEINRLCEGRLGTLRLLLAAGAVVEPEEEREAEDRADQRPDAVLLLQARV